MKKYQRNESIVYKEEEDGAFLFDPDTGNLKYMNQTGREAYLMLDGQSDVQGVIQHLFDQFPEVEPRQIEEDLEVFLTDLKEHGFISPL